MNTESLILYTTAAFLGFIHTLLGPDHYLPFIVLKKARNWNIRRTLSITALCGTGHVLSSMLIGFIGIIAGISLNSLEIIDEYRGNIAAYLLIGFGLFYMIWGIRRAFKNKPHSHVHFHENGSAHSHTHDHYDEHIHIHETGKKKLTAWALFIIFVLGPCESLIPLLMYPAARNSTSELIITASIFGSVTILTMVTITYLALKGMSFLNPGKPERYTHAIAGFAIFASGLAIQLLGL